MGARLRSWWQQIKKHRVAIGVVAMVLVVAITLIIVGYWFDWAGFNGYNKITVAHTISGTNAGTVIRTEEYQPGKTLWDWLQLLIIPVVLAIGGFWLDQIQKSREQRTTQQQAELEHRLTRDSQQETALQQYIDKMSELLLNEHLSELKPEYEKIGKIARVRTLTVLPRLDRKRKRSVLQFLRESGLIERGKSIIDLNGADLRDADLMGADLGYANLSGAMLKGTDLGYANLSGADLSKTELAETDLFEAKLSNANLSGAFLSDADLREADLSNALLNKTSLMLELSEASPSEADLSSASLSKISYLKAILSEIPKRTVHLDGAFLGGANLIGANLIGANMSGADLGYADLSRAKVTTEQLNQAKSLKGATMPDGSTHP